MPGPMRDTTLLLLLLLLLLPPSTTVTDADLTRCTIILMAETTGNTVQNCCCCWWWCWCWYDWMKRVQRMCRRSLRADRKERTGSSDLCLENLMNKSTNKSMNQRINECIDVWSSWKYYTILLFVAFSVMVSVCQLGSMDNKKNQSWVSSEAKSCLPCNYYSWTLWSLASTLVVVHLKHCFLSLFIITDITIHQLLFLLGYYFDDDVPCAVLFNEQDGNFWFWVPGEAVVIL